MEIVTYYNCPKYNDFILSYAQKMDISPIQINDLTEINEKYSLIFISERTLLEIDMTLHNNLFFILIVDDIFLRTSYSNSNILGIIGPKGSFYQQDVIIRNAYQYISSQLENSQITELNKKLSPLLNEAFSQMKKVKSIHERVVPVRSKDFGNIEVCSKFSAGMRSGGDQFDYFKFGQSQFIITLSESDSYISSGIFLKHIAKLRTFDERRDASDLVRDVTVSILSELQELSVSNSVRNFFIALVDLNKLTFSGYVFGSIFNISNNKSLQLEGTPINPSFIDNSFFSFSLKKGEKYAFFSSGILTSFSDEVNRKRFISRVKTLISGDSKSLLNESFFQLSHNDDGFLQDDDATILLMEVKANALTSI